VNPKRLAVSIPPFCASSFLALVRTKGECMKIAARIIVLEHQARP
jgi:hypothetical protein